MWWCPRGYALRARGRARLGQVPGQVRAELVRGSGRFLRRDRVDREAAVVLRQRRHARHLLPRALPVARREPAAAVAEGDHAVGRPRRPVSRPGLSRRHLRDGVLRQRGSRPTWRTTCWAARAPTTRTRSTTTCSGNGHRNNLDSEFWRMRSAQWDKIKVPLYSVGNWGGLALHLRGNIEGFMNAASKHKKLRIHSGTHFHPFHSEEGRIDQLRWFDHWLKGKDTGIMDEPPVKLKIRTGGDKTTSSYRVPVRERVAARAHAVDEDVSQVTASAGQNVDADGRRARCSRSRRKPRSAATRRARPTHAGVSSSAPSHATGSMDRTGISFMSAPLARGHRDHRARSCSSCGCRARRRTWTSSRRSATSVPTARTSGKSGQQGGTSAGDEGLAARVAPQARPAEVAAVPAVSRAQRAAVAERRARPSNARSRSGRRAWCSRRATGCGSTSSRATASAHRRTALPRRLQHRRGEHACTPAGRGCRTSCCRWCRRRSDETM